MDAHRQKTPPGQRKLPILLSLRDLTPPPIAERASQESADSGAPSQTGALRRERRRRQTSSGSTALRYSHGLVAAAVVLVCGLGYYALRGDANNAPVADQDWEGDALAADLSPPAVSFDADTEFWNQGDQTAESTFSSAPSGGLNSFSTPTPESPYQTADAPYAAEALPPPTEPVLNPADNIAESTLENGPAFSQTQQPSLEFNGPQTPAAYPTTSAQYPTTSAQYPTAKAAPPKPVATSPSYPTTKY